MQTVRSKFVQKYKQLARQWYSGWHGVDESILGEIDILLEQFSNGVSMSPSEFADALAHYAPTEQRDIIREAVMDIPPVNSNTGQLLPTVEAQREWFERQRDILSHRYTGRDYDIAVDQLNSIYTAVEEDREISELEWVIMEAVTTLERYDVCKALGYLSGLDHQDRWDHMVTLTNIAEVTAGMPSNGLFYDRMCELLDGRQRELTDQHKEVLVKMYAGSSLKTISDILEYLGDVQ